MKTIKTKFSLCGVIAFAAITVFLIAGCNINVSTSSGTSDPKTPVAGDFTVGNLTQYADNVIAVTVEPKSGKSGGTVTVYYDGAISLPQGVGTYAVTFNVAKADGWNAATGLSGGTLTVIPPVEPVDSLEEAAAYLSEADGGESAEDAVYLLVKIDLEDMTDGDSGWQQLLDAIADADKFITLDLSLCEMDGTEFDPVSSISTGKDKIVSITLPAAVESIASGNSSYPAFKNFDNLEIVNGASVTSIGDCAFAKCSSLTEVSFPLAESIGTAAFADCSSLTEASFPLAESIGSSAFANCSSLTKANFPLAESIGIGAFLLCSSLTEASFPLAESIGIGAFYGCSSLTEVSFPASAYIDGNPFIGCTALVSINLTGNGGLSVTANGKALVKDVTGGKELIAYLSAAGSISMDDIISIGIGAFRDCSSLTEANFPLAESISFGAFRDCSSLTEASFPLAESIGGFAFLACSSLSSITIAADCDIDSNAQIRGDFSDYYDSQSKAAGTYTYNGSAWEGP